MVNAEFGVDEHTILDHINLHINKGSSLIISGATGSGKTTLVNLLTGIYEGNQGMVIYKNDGQVINGRPNVSYMLQDEYIFDDTIINNILIGNRNLTQAELDKIIEVCELGNIVGNHIGAIGDNGQKISGGERKRVLIARTIADIHSDIFLFDEMSASLDKETFMRIWNKVDLYLKDKIRIYIEHDMSIKDKVDRVVSMDDGMIIGN